MAAALGDLLRVIDQQAYLSEEVLNIYYYRVTSVTGFTNDGYASILDWFEENILTPVAAIQNARLNHNKLTIMNLTNGVDLLDRVEDVDGTFTSDEADDLPSYVSQGFRLIREVLTTRNGYKRYSGMCAASQNGNVSNYTGSLRTDIEDGLKADVVVGIVTLAEPVIVKHPIGSPPVASYLYSSVGDAQMSPLMGTQNTRKQKNS